MLWMDELEYLGTAVSTKPTCTLSPPFHISITPVLRTMRSVALSVLAIAASGALANTEESPKPTFTVSGLL